MSWFSKKIKKIAKNDPTAKLHVKALNKAGLGSGNTLRRIVDPISIQQEKIQKGAPITSRTMFDPGNELQEDPNPAKRAERQAQAGYQQGFDASANVPIPGVTGPVTPLPGGSAQPPQPMPSQSPFQAQGPYGQQAMQMAGLLGQRMQPHVMPTYGLLGQPADALAQREFGARPGGGGGWGTGPMMGSAISQAAARAAPGYQIPQTQPIVQPQMQPQPMGVAPMKGPFLFNRGK